MNHILKTHSQYFERIDSGEKTFEVRRNDRDFQTGDILILEDYNPQTNTYSERHITAEIKYILNGDQFGIEKGFCVMAINVISKNF